MKLSNIRSDSWVQLVLAIDREEHPDHALLAAALGRGEHVPREAQEYLAKIVSKAPSLARGRPPGSKSTARGSFWEDCLLDERDVLIASLKEKRVSKPAQVADEQLEKKYRLGPDTLAMHCAKAARREVPRRYPSTRDRKEPYLLWYSLQCARPLVREPEV